MQRTWVRRLVAGPLLLWLALLQLPLPVRAPVEKDASIAYPCMHRACGCTDAHHCWTSCCCTTKQERIAWAREHLGYIPAELAHANDNHSPARACCSHRSSFKTSETTFWEGDASAEPLEKENFPSVVARREPRPPGSETASKKPAPKSGSSIVILSQLQQCRGTSAGWTIFSIAIPAAPGPSIVTAHTPLEQAPPTLETTADSFAADLPTPPPRSGCCVTASV